MLKNIFINIILDKKKTELNRNELFHMDFLLFDMIRIL